MVRRAIVALIVLLVPALAEARGGRGFSIGLRGSTKSASHATRPSPPRVGAGVGVVIPLSRRSSEPSPERGGGAAPPRVVSPAAATAAAVEPAPLRPWCEGGQIVGGFCALN
ncbi:MAG TPA: hypothetical protein VKB16_23190 [Beijerinckiaceae bacterium]|jgi:hypothetical protein|nr:hypothetical protein [Beijerinckiaceae bacterium]